MNPNSSAALLPPTKVADILVCVNGLYMPVYAKLFPEPRMATALRESWIRYGVAGLRIAFTSE